MAILEVNKDNFENEVLKCEKKVLADFNASWCGPCRMLKPVLDEFSENNTDIKVISINVDDEEELASKYNVSSIPCLILFDKGNEIKRNIGFISKENIESMVGKE